MWGGGCWAGLNEHTEGCVWGRWGPVWAGKIRGAPVRPGLTHHSPRRWWRWRRRQRWGGPANANSLISRLISDSKQQRPDGGRGANYQGGQHWPSIECQRLRQLSAGHCRCASLAVTTGPVAWQLSAAARHCCRHRRRLSAGPLISGRQDEDKRVGTIADDSSDIYNNWFP